MPADIDHGPQLAVFVARNQNGQGAQLGGYEIARVQQLPLGAHDLPGTAEDDLLLQRKDPWIGVELGRKVPTPRQESVDLDGIDGLRGPEGDICVNVHDCVPKLMD
jgi:hypothetical protein